MLNWKHKDPTPYHTKLRGRALNSQKAEGDNVRSFQLALYRLNDDIRRARILIHKSGPLGNNAKELENLARMYLRGMQEVAKLLRGVKTAPNASAPR
jgi:hypothetical protein